jgi:hypothetical protein
MDLPLLLAGPVLRRVEPGLVSVWLAFSQPSRAILKVWEGRAETGRADPFVTSVETPTLRVGAKLHVVQVTAQLAALAPQPAGMAGASFEPDSLYSYDLEIRKLADPPGAEPQTLATLHLLEEGVVDGVPRLPLGFEPGLLPGFAPPPSDLTHLNLLYGSCRRPLHPDPDALAMVDDLIFGENRYQDPRARPHQLFLGGDQIYADDVSLIHMPLVMQVGVQLIGATGDAEFPDPVEHLPVDSALLLQDEAKAADPDPLAGYTPQEQAATDQDPWIPAGRRYWPEGRRLDTTRIDAQFTSEDGDSHVLSLGEFSALYLSVWSPAVWGDEVVGARWAPDGTAPQQSQTLRWDQALPPYDAEAPDPGEGAIVMDPVMFPDRIAGHLYTPPKPPKHPPTPDELTLAARVHQQGLRHAFAVHAEFRKNLPKVQRALANVATYMILDDHDVTDDYFLNPVWRRRVLGQRLGKAVLDNAMIAYAVFQDWGNDPLAYRTGAKAQLLHLVEQLFPENLAKGPDPAAITAIEQLLTHDVKELTQTPDRRFDETNPALKWHFGIDGPKHRVIAFDNRTRRSYAGQNGPPGNVSKSAMVDQIPLPPLPADREILVVIAPLQVIGPPVLDEIVAPLSYRMFDAFGATDKDGLTSASSPTGLREMPGTNPDAIEAWAFDAVTFEHLLERLEPYGRAVLLSGDVHYSSGTVMSYWKGEDAQPARFAQFTSSGFKNVMPSMITFIDPALGLSQQLVRLDLGTERIAWKEVADELVLLPTGAVLEDLKPVMKSRLKNVPVMVPSWGWPDLNDPDDAQSFDPAKTSRLNPAHPPDWRWRVKPLLDQRAEIDRPPAVRLAELAPDTDAVLAAPTTVFEGYQRLAARHQHALNRLRNARQILFRANVGRVRFEKPDGDTLDAVHEVFTTFSDPDEPAALDVEPEIFLKQVARLAPVVEEPPTHLRPRAIVAVDPPPGGP